MVSVAQKARADEPKRMTHTWGGKSAPAPVTSPAGDLYRRAARPPGAGRAARLPGGVAISSAERASLTWLANLAAVITHARQTSVGAPRTPCCSRE